MGLYFKQNLYWVSVCSVKMWLSEQQKMLIIWKHCATVHIIYCIYHCCCKLRAIVCKSSCIDRHYIDHNRVLESDLRVDDQIGDHPMFFQVRVSALSISGLHLVWSFQMLQRDWRDVDPPRQEKWTDDERLTAWVIVPLTAPSNIFFTF